MTKSDVIFYHTRWYIDEHRQFIYCNSIEEVPKMDIFDLTGKVAIVTGGNQGIGLAISRGLARAGAAVIIANRRAEEGTKAAESLKKEGLNAAPIPTNVSDESSIAAMVAKVMASHGKIDILVNNAGGCTPPKPFLEMSDKDWDFDIDVNLRSTRNGTKTVLPIMIKQKSGKIVNITSGAGIHGGMFTSGYAAAKAGIIGFSMGVAKEAAPHGININCVSPGVADTGFARNAPPGLLENFPKTVPIGRLTTTQDIANAVVFLASDASCDIVGQVLVVSGGVSP